MNRFAAAFLILAGLAAVAGWIAAGGGTGDEAGAGRNAWREVPAPARSSETIADARAQLAASGLFGADLAPEAVIAATDPEGAEEILLPFPGILSAAVIDGREMVVLDNGEGRIVAGEGDSVQGWTIRAIDMNSVTVERGDERLDLPIFRIDS